MRLSLSLQVVALHSKGVPKTEDGNIVLRNGSHVKGDIRSLGLRDNDILWEANLGVRISFIVDSIRIYSTNPEADTKQLLTGFLTDIQRGGAPVPLAVAPSSVAKRSRPQLANGSARAAVFDGMTEEAVDRFGPGYDPMFLGVEVPLPEVGECARQFGRPLIVSRGAVLWCACTQCEAASPTTCCHIYIGIGLYQRTGMCSSPSDQCSNIFDEQHNNSIQSVGCADTNHS